MILKIAQAVRDSGGRAVIVGGSVRDRLINAAQGAHTQQAANVDTDIELFGLDVAQAQTVLSTFGTVKAVGRAFPVLRINGLDVDFSLPRTSSLGDGVRGDLRQSDPALDFASAARRRDLTINAMGFDPLNGEVLDPLDGQKDLAQGRLRAADPDLFIEDPIRGLRVARFAARFEMQADEELTALCAGLNLGEVSPERIFDEWRKMLRQAKRPSMALNFLQSSGLLAAFPQLHAIQGVPQDARYHPEGDVWVHTLMVLDVATSLRVGDGSDDALMFAALCHDLGKPDTTEIVDERIRSHAHESVGVGLSEAFLSAMRAPQDLTRCVAALVKDHLVPAQFPAQGARRAAYRRLARRLHQAGASMELLERLARADQWGRTTPDALARVFPAGEKFLAQAEKYSVNVEAPVDAVLGRHLIARGYKPGAAFSDLLQRCRELQDDTGLSDPEQILDELGIAQK